MIPDSEEKVSNIQNNLAAKIALVLGVMMNDISSSNFFKNNVQNDQVVTKFLKKFEDDHLFKTKQLETRFVN